MTNLSQLGNLMPKANKQYLPKIISHRMELPVFYTNLKNMKELKEKNSANEPFKKEAKYENQPEECQTNYPIENNKLCKVGTFRAQGCRETQEDQVRVVALKQWSEITSEQQKNALKLAFEFMEETFGEEFVGSTASVAIISKKDNEKNSFERTIAYLGDSRVFQIDGKKIESLTKPHLATCPDEQKRIEDENKVKKENGLSDDQMGYIASVPLAGVRLNAILQMTRSFGDQDHDGKGLSHEPTIEQKTIAVNQDNETHIIVASDGLTDHLDESEIVATLGKNSSRSPAELASILGIDVINKQIGGDRGDNVTIAVFPVSTLPENETVCIQVFDGHGGKTVAENIANHFGYFLQVIINHIKDYNDRLKEDKLVENDHKLPTINELAEIYRLISTDEEKCNPNAIDYENMVQDDRVIGLSRFNATFLLKTLTSDASIATCFVMCLAVGVISFSMASFTLFAASAAVSGILLVGLFAKRCYGTGSAVDDLVSNRSLHESALTN